MGAISWIGELSGPSGSAGLCVGPYWLAIGSKRGYRSVLYRLGWFIYTPHKRSLGASLAYQSSVDCAVNYFRWAYRAGTPQAQHCPALIRLPPFVIVYSSSSSLYIIIYKYYTKGPFGFAISKSVI
jgi:hypothetical protein